ncbi:MAG: choice-of-anchor D domain-containing protein [Myxococcales bacterium]|nr:choice-of-anchor D domain-containing protein [Myxococcales bacterium]
MKPSFVARGALVLGVLALAVSGCDCRGNPGVNRSLGELGVVWRNAQGERIISRDAVYDFGNALVGEKKELTMTVRNSGAGKLSLMKLERTTGDSVAIGAAPADTDAFEVQFTTAELEPSGQVEYRMFFTPRGLKGDWEVKLLLTSEGARPEDATAVITLRGQGEKGSCDLPTTIDFGKVPVGETLTYAVPYLNPTSLPAIGQVGAITGTDASNFGFAPNTPMGNVPVNPMSTTEVVFTFSPTEKRQYTAQVTMKGAGECPEQTVTITGEGSDDVLTWTPTELNYGFVSPGYEAVREVLFTNLSNVPITLTEVTSGSPADFYQVVTPGGDATRFVVPGGGATTPLKVACNPSQLGRRDSTLTFKTPLTRAAMGTITLKCTGGGPKIKVTPRPTLGFGRVGYFPGSSSFSVTRKVNVQNVGTRPPMPDPTSALFLGRVAMDGTPGELPLFELQPKNAQTAQDEFTVALGSPYNPANGLQAIAGQNFVDLSVTLNPKSVGLKEAELIIYSNDSTEPEVRLTVTADAQQLPPCNYRVEPAMANFGLVAPGQTKDLPITITNLGQAQTDVCYLSGIDLSAGTDLAYSLVGGPVVEKELQPGQSWNVVVRVAPTGATPTTLVTLTGALTFNVTSPTNPQGLVPLRTSVGPSCLAITPDPLDFGTTKPGCNSAPRTLNVYNVCNTTMTIMGFSVPAAGGQAPGGPNCAGTNPCPEFFRVVTPMIPTGGLSLPPGAAPVQLQMKYAPIDVGADTGALAIDAIQNGQSITYLVGLQGNGDATGQQTDTFLQDQSPKADILLVVDDSGSMQDKQSSLAANFSSFIQYAVAANVDYHIGITTTSTARQECVPGFGCLGNSKAPAGELYLDGPTNSRVITPATTNVSQVFARMANVGIDGNGTEAGLETSVMALTPPKVANENAGFLRTDANLAVVIISDAGDQSPQPVSYYQNRLINVKGFNRLSMFTFSTIGPLLPSEPSGCTYDGGGDVARYRAITNYTSGVTDEICNSNWATTLQNLGRTAFGFRTQFFLNNVPDLSMGQTISVMVNGQPVPAANWTYDSASNSIKFTSTTTPGPGQTLTVTYNTACL